MPKTKDTPGRGGVRKGAGRPDTGARGNRAMANLTPDDAALLRGLMVELRETASKVLARGLHALMNELSEEKQRQKTRRV